MLIVRRAKLYYAVSGIIAPIGGRPVHRTATYRPVEPVMCITSSLIRIVSKLKFRDYRKIGEEKNEARRSRNGRFQY